MSPTQPAPGGLSTRRPLRGRVLQVAEALATPYLPSDFLDLFAPMRIGADLRGRIVAVRPETADSATIVIQPSKGWAGHTPGQYIRLGIDVDGVRLWRAYSVTSGVNANELTITVKAMTDGKVSNYLIRRARVGEVVQLDQATGEFTLPTPLPDKALFITAGSGVTPVMGMLRNHTLNDAVVIHCAPTKEEMIFRNDLRALAAGGAIRLIERYDDEHGILDVAELAALVPDLHERITWACGPAGLLEAVEEHHEHKGLTVHTERFRPTVLVTGEGGSVNFATSNAIVDAPGDAPILDAAEAAGVLMPSGCRMGICYGCVLPLREGAVRDLRNGELTIAVEGDNVLIQTCINAAAGDCHIDH